jgi:hypothetical protein
MDQRHIRRDVGQRYGPIDRRIAAAADDDTHAPKRLAPGDEIEDRGALILLDAVERRAVGTESAGAGGDDHRTRPDRRAGAGGEFEAAIGEAFQAVHLLPQMKHRPERSRLFGQPIDQTLAVDRRMARDVVDRLLRVERRALAADDVQRIDDVAAHAQHAAFEDREKADRTGADDRHIGFVDLAHTEKYFACGWCTTMALVDCSGSSWSSSVSVMPIASAFSKSRICR